MADARARLRKDADPGAKPRELAAADRASRAHEQGAWAPAGQRAASDGAAASARAAGAGVRATRSADTPRPGADLRAHRRGAGRVTCGGRTRSGRATCRAVASAGTAGTGSSPRSAEPSVGIDWWARRRHRQGIAPVAGGTAAAVRRRRRGRGSGFTRARRERRGARNGGLIRTDGRRDRLAQRSSGTARAWLRRGDGIQRFRNSGPEQVRRCGTGSHGRVRRAPNARHPPASGTVDGKGRGRHAGPACALHQ